jgi:putative endonuclease
METNRFARGAFGEAMAALFLESRGYRILARNFRAGRREIDLIVERGELLVAVEVKWRSGDGQLQAAEAWRPAQRARAADGALSAMTRIPGGTTRPWRFDLVLIVEHARSLELEHRAGVWAPGGSFW